MALEAKDSALRAGLKTLLVTSAAGSSQSDKEIYTVLATGITALRNRIKESSKKKRFASDTVDEGLENGSDRISRGTPEKKGSLTARAIRGGLTAAAAASLAGSSDSDREIYSLLGAGIGLLKRRKEEKQQQEKEESDRIRGSSTRVSSTEDMTLTSETFKEYENRLFDKIDTIISYLLTQKEIERDATLKEEEARLEMKPEVQQKRVVAEKKDDKKRFFESLKKMLPSGKTLAIGASITAAVAGIASLSSYLMTTKKDVDDLEGEEKETDVESLIKEAENAENEIIPGSRQQPPPEETPPEQPQAPSVQTPAAPPAPPAPSTAPAPTAPAAPANAGTPQQVTSTTPPAATAGSAVRTDQFMKRHEGFSPTVYKDPAPGAYPTIGYGHKLKPEELKSNKITLSNGKEIDISKGITEAQGKEIFDDDKKGHQEKTMAALEKLGVDTSRLNPDVAFAVNDLGFNAGPGIFAKSPRLVAALKANDLNAIAAELRTTGRTAGGVKLGGLVKRANERADIVLASTQGSTIAVASAEANAARAGNRVPGGVTAPVAINNQQTTSMPNEQPSLSTRNPDPSFNTMNNKQRIAIS